jgi:G3E family GTPase
MTPPIPVSVLTGFLGSGKTTLLNRLLKDPALRDTAVIINEFGDVGIDHLLVEQSGDGVIELSDGCLCCTVRGELVDTLADLLDRLQTGRVKALERVVIETTGLADPAPVLHAIMGHPVLAQNFRLDGVVVAVDAVNGDSTLDTHEEAVKQVAVADRIVLTKTDLTHPASEAFASLAARLERLNPAAPQIAAQAEDAVAGTLLACGLYNPATKSADVARWLRDEAYADRHDHAHDVNRHDARIRAFTLTHDRPIDRGALDMFIDLLRSSQGEQLLRMKGIVCLADDPGRPVVIHGVQTIFHPAARLAAWPDADHRSRLVVITRDLDEDFVRRLFLAFTGRPQVDTPDRQSVENNPLSIPGFRPDQSALFDEESVAAIDGACLDQTVSVFDAKMRDVDHGQRIAGFNPDARSGGKRGHAFLGLENRKRAFQATQVIAFDTTSVGHAFYQTLHQAFFLRGPLAAAPTGSAGDGVGMATGVVFSATEAEGRGSGETELGATVSSWRTDTALFSVLPGCSGFGASTPATAGVMIGFSSSATALANSSSYLSWCAA